MAAKRSGKGAGGSGRSRKPASKKSSAPAAKRARTAAQRNSSSARAAKKQRTSGTPASSSAAPKAKRAQHTRARASGSISAGRTDLYKENVHEYVAPAEPTFVDTAPATYLAVDGFGQPGDAEFQRCVESLYAVAYATRFTSRFAGRDYVVSRLEALWWRDDEVRQQAERGDWHWQLLIRVPAFVIDGQVAAAISQLLANEKPVEVTRVRRIELNEGRCVQLLHVGRYDDAARDISRMERAATDAGLSFAGRHHEIYLSDPKRVPADQLRTIYRRPVV